jgi:uncharacterized protein (UPF0147 family)
VKAHCSLKRFFKILSMLAHLNQQVQIPKNVSQTAISIYSGLHPTRVGNFRQKNYSAEDGIDGTNG